MILNDFQPDMFNHLEMEKKEFIEDNDLNEKFSKAYKKYYTFLEQYIDKIINISKYDNLIAFHDSKLECVKKDDMDIYQSLSSFKYFYLRNTLYIENLTEQELELLISKEAYDEEVQALISSTYKKIITTSLSNENININYGPMESAAFYAPANALVLGFRYDPEFDGELAKKDDDAWYDNYQEQQFFVMTTLHNLEEETKEKLEVLIRVIKYDEFSIKKKDNNDIRFVK